jgi:hypothetical protein
LNISPSTVASGSTRTITALVRDIRGNPITTQYGITFDSTGGTSTGSFGSINNLGSGNYSVGYTGVVAGSAQTVRILVDGSILSGVTATIQVTPGPVDTSNSSFTISATTVQSGTTATLSAQLRDTNGNRITGHAVTFTKSSTAGSDGTISPSPATETTPPANSGNYQAIYTATQQGAAQTLTLTFDGSQVSAMTQSVTVISGPPAQLGVSAPASPFSTTQCTGPITISLRDAANNATVSLTDTVIAFSSPDLDSDGVSEHEGQIYSDSGCSTELTELDISPGVSSGSFYYKNYLPESYTLTFTPPSGITPASLVMTTKAVLSWIGSAVASSTMAGSGTGFVGTDAGPGFGFVEPFGMIRYGNFLYVSDRGAFRILKFNLSTTPYTYVGWVGYIDSTEGISSGCAAQAPGDWTAGWCTGGRAQNIQGMNVLAGLGADSNYVYAAVDDRVIRIAQSDGSYGGWIGKVKTNLPSSCTGGSPSSNTATPGWCTDDGDYTSGNGDGQFNNAADVTAMGGKLYVVDQSNHRIQRWSAAGIYEGWLGNVGASSPTGSPDSAYNSDCTSATATGNFPGAFCVGGVAQAMTRRNWSVTAPEKAIPGEGFSTPINISNDGTYLYVSDQGNERIARVDMSTNPYTISWIGYVLRNTTTNPTIPLSQPSGAYSQSWVQGGSSQEKSDGNGHQPLGITASPPYLFFGDVYSRVVRVDLADGQNHVHIGRVSASPTGGQPGCSSTPVMGTTPGFCTGGSYTRYGATNSTFSEARATEVFGNELFVIDRYNFRIQRFNKVTGAFIGWMGAVAHNQDSWTTVMPASSFGSRGWNDQSFWDISNQFSTMGIAGDYIYIPDYSVARIKRYSKRLGKFGGYLGIFDLSKGFLPTGPDSCLGVTSGMTPDWCTGGGKTNSSSGVQGYNNPTSVTTDGHYIYVASQGNARVDRIDKDSGLYGGWIGRVNGAPTDGDAGCTDPGLSGNRTPGWCIGGTAQSGNGDGQFRSSLKSVYYDSDIGKLFILDDSRLFRVDPTSGLNEATIGYISTTNVSGCSLTTNVPNQWCTTAQAQGAGSSNYGSMNDPVGIWTDSNNIYLSDWNTHRILRYNKSTGAPNGFIGHPASATGLNVTATGGACNGFSDFTKALPGWCYGTAVGVAMATPQAGSGNGDFNSPRGIWGDGTYLYVADAGNHRIVRIKLSDGSFQGWKGAIASTTDISPAECATDASTVGYTQRWCKGGLSAMSTKMGGFALPVGIIGDGNYLYVHDGRNNRLVTVPLN